jgi:hypothetical protein
MSDNDSPTTHPPQSGWWSPRNRRFLLCRLRVSDRAVGHPDSSAGVVYAVPDAAWARDLELPLLEVDAVDGPGAKRALERVLAIVAVARIARDPIPGSPSVGRRCGTDLVQALGRPSSSRFRAGFCGGGLR